MLAVSLRSYSPTMLLHALRLLLLSFAMAVGVATLAGLGRVVGSKGPVPAEDRQAGRGRRRPAAILLASGAVGLAVWMSVLVFEFNQDPVVVVDGQRVTCATVKADDDLAERVGEKCDLLSNDLAREALRQAAVAGLVAAVASAVTLWGAFGRTRHGRASATMSTTSFDG